MPNTEWKPPVDAQVVEGWTPPTDAVELKKKVDTEESVIGSEQEPSVSEQPPQETPTPSELPKVNGLEKGVSLKQLNVMLSDLPEESQIALKGNTLKSKVNELREVESQLPAQEFKRKLKLGVGGEFQQKLTGQLPYDPTIAIRKNNLTKEINTIKGDVLAKNGTKGFIKLTAYETLEDEDAQAFGRAVDRMDAELGERSPYYRRDMMNQMLDQRLSELDIAAFPSTEEGVKALESEIRNITGQTAWENGFILQEDGSVEDRFSSDDRLDEYIQEEGRVGFGKELVYKLASGIETFSGGMMDVLGFVTGLGALDSWQQAAVGGYMRSEELRKVANRYDKSVEDYTKEGDVVNAAGAAVSQTVESLPNMLPMLFNPQYGVYVMGATSTAQKYRELEDVNMPEWLKMYNSVISGMNEVVWEKITTVPILMKSKKALSEIGESTVRKNIPSVAKKTVGAAIIGVPQSIQEGLSEVATEYMNNMVDKLTYDSDRDLSQGLFDAFTSGVLLGKVFTLPQNAAWMRQKFGTPEATKKYIKEIISKLPFDISQESKLDIAEKIIERDKVKDKDPALKEEGELERLNTEIKEDVKKAQTEVKGAETIQTTTEGEIVAEKTAETPLVASESMNEAESEIPAVSQLSTGANVYYESSSVRVNDSKGGVRLNVTDVDGGMASASVVFNSVKEAVEIAKMIDRAYPDGVPVAVDAEAMVNTFKDIAKETAQQPIGEQPIADEGGVTTPDVSQDRTLAAEATREGIVASFELGEVEPARNQLREFFNRNWSALGLSDAQQKSTINAAMKVSAPAQAQKLIDKVLTQSTEALQKQGLKTSEADVEAAFKKHFADLGKQISEKRRETALKTTAKARIKSLKEADAFVEKSWNDFKKANRATMKDMPQRIQNMMRDKAFKMTERNVDTTFEFFKNVMFNQKYADNLNKVGEKLEKWKKQKFKGEIKDKVTTLDETTLKSRHIYGKQEVDTFLNKMDVTVTEMTTDMVSKLNKALDSMMGKLPEYTPILEFMDKYRDVVNRSIVENDTSISLKEKDVDKVVKKVSDLQESLGKVKEQLSQGELNVEDVLNLQKKRNGLNLALDKFEDLLSNQDKETIEKALKEINDYFEVGYRDMNQQSLDLFEEAMDVIRKEQISKIQPQEMPTAPAQQLWDRVVKMANAMMFEGGEQLWSEEAARNRRSFLNPSTIELLNHTIEEYNRSGVIPHEFYSMGQDFLTSGLAGDLFNVTMLLKNHKGRQAQISIKEAIDSWGAMQAQYTTGMDSWLDLETKTDKPLERLLTTAFDNAVERARRNAELASQPFMKALRKAQGRPYVPVVKLKETYKQKIIKNRIYEIANNWAAYEEATVTPKALGETAYVLPATKRPNGVEVERKVFDKHDSKEKNFNEAQEYANQHKEDYVDVDDIGRRIRNRDYLNNTLSPNKGEKSLLVDISLDTYKSFESDYVVVKDEATARQYLNEAEYDVMEEMFSLFEKETDKMVAIAHMEKKDVKVLKRYVPREIKSSHSPNRLSDNMHSIMDDAKNGKPIKVTGRIQSRTPQSQGWINTDAESVVRNYLTEVNLSYELKPLLDREFRAFDKVKSRLKMLGKDEKHVDKIHIPQDEQAFWYSDVPLLRRPEVIEDLTFKDMEQFVVNQKQDRINRYEQQMRVGKILPKKVGWRIGDDYYDLSKGVNEFSKLAKVSVLMNWARKQMDREPQRVRQYIERGFKLTDSKRILELKEIFPYLEQGSLMQSWLDDMVSRYGDPEFTWGDTTKVKEMIDEYMSSADRQTKPEAWIPKFDEVYEGLTGEKLDTEKFKLDVDFRNEVLSSPYFNQAVAIADSYAASLHFARSQGAMSGVFYNMLQPGTSGYALFTPVQSYMLQLYKNTKIAKDKIIRGSELGRDVEAKRIAGAVVNSAAYSMMRTIVVSINMIAVGVAMDREDWVEEGWERIKAVGTVEGVVGNLVGGVTNLIMSGATGVGTQLANLMVAWLEGLEQEYTDDPVWQEKIRQYRKQMKSVVGVGYFDVGDVRSGKIQIKHIINIFLPVVGSFAVDVYESGASAVEGVIDRNRVFQGRPMSEDDTAAQASRFLFYMLMISKGAIPFAKSVKEVTGEMIKMTRKKPFRMSIEENINRMNIVSEAGLALSTFINEKEYRKEEGNNRYVVNVNGVWRKMRSVGEGEDEKAQIKINGIWRDAKPEELAHKKYASIVKSQEFMKHKATIDGLEGERTYADLWRGFQTNNQAWGRMEKLYKDIQEDENLTPKQKQLIYDELEPEFDSMVQAIWNNDRYIDVTVKLMSKYREITKRQEDFDFGIEKKFMELDLKIN